MRTNLLYPTWSDLEKTARACTACGLSAERTQVVFGSGPLDARLVLIGEAPGAQEDEQGIPFVGRSGALLDRLLVAVGLNRADTYIANVVKCRPPDNRNPTRTEIATCRPFLDAQLAFLQPVVIVPLGNFATRLLLGTKTGITKMRGQVMHLPRRSDVDCEGPFPIVIPALHPAAVLRGGGAAFDRAAEDFAVIAHTLRTSEASRR